MYSKKVKKQEKKGYIQTLRGTLQLGKRREGNGIGKRYKKTSTVTVIMLS